jgi:uncharacterized protein YjgD (DUF1641 family)
MGKPIKSVPSAVTAGGVKPELQAVNRLAELLVEYEESVRDALELLQLLEERGLLTFAVGLLRNYGEVFTVFSQWISGGNNLNHIRNLVEVYEGLKLSNPVHAKRIVRALSRAVEYAAREDSKDKNMGLFALLRELGDPDVNRGIRIVLSFLRGLGHSDERQ